MEYIKGEDLMKRWKIVKKVLVAIISSFLVCCIGCNTSQTYPNDIILLERYLQSYWRYENNGRYLDQYGYVYEYNFDEGTKYPLMEYKIKSEEDYLKVVLNESYYSGKPIGKIDEEKLKNILKELRRVNPRASMTKKWMASDAGQVILFTLDGDGKLLPLHGYGSLKIELQDNAAKKLTKMWDELQLVQCDEVACISELESAKVKNGLSNQVGGTVTITETKNLQFKDGELTFRVLGLDNEEILFEDVNVETTGNMKAEVEKKVENSLSTIKIKLTGTSKDTESITFHNFKLTSYQLIPEIEYSLLIQGNGLINYGRDNIGIPGFINLRKEVDDYPTCKYRNISFDITNVEDFICTDEGELVIALDVIEQAYGLRENKVKKEGDHVQLILGKRIVEFTVDSDEVIIDQVAHTKMNAKVVKGESGIMVPAKAMAILVSSEFIQLNDDSYMFYNVYNQ